jgi:hypothetical protein
MTVQAASDPPGTAGADAERPTTFHGSDPDTAAAAAICQSSPTGCQARTRLYRHGVLEREGFPVDDISDYLEDESAVIWLDLRKPSREDLSVLSAEFGLHPVAIEDAVYVHERPKLDRYRGYLFLVCYAVHLDAVTGELGMSELAAFITERALITVRKDDGLDIGAVVNYWDASHDLAKYGVGFLLYGLLDNVVDGHFAAVQALDDSIEGLEDKLFDDKPRLDHEVQRRSFEMRKSLVLLRRGCPAHARGGELADAPRPAGGDRAAASLLPGPLRPRAAGDGVDGEPARSGDHGPGDQPDHPGQPHEHHHQEGHELGSHHRGAHVRHRALRDERPLSRLRSALGCGSFVRLHGRHGGRPLCRLQAEGLAVAGARGGAQQGSEEGGADTGQETPSLVLAPSMDTTGAPRRRTWPRLVLSAQRRHICRIFW